MMREDSVGERVLRLSAVLVLGGVVFLSGCAGGESSGGADDGLEVVNIGFIGPLSGGAAYYGRNVQRGVMMAADEID